MDRRSLNLGQFRTSGGMKLKALASRDSTTCMVKTFIRETLIKPQKLFFWKLSIPGPHLFLICPLPCMIIVKLSLNDGNEITIQSIGAIILVELRRNQKFWMGGAQNGEIL